MAAIKIQQTWRRHKAYSAFAQLKYLMVKATVIQRKFRLYQLKKSTKISRTMAPIVMTHTSSDVFMFEILPPCEGGAGWREPNPWLPASRAVLSSDQKLRLVAARLVRIASLPRLDASGR